jgi:hypothetical protein
MSNIGNIKFSYFDKVNKKIKENNIINISENFFIIIIYFDQTDIPITIIPSPGPNVSSSSYDTNISVSNVIGATSISLVGSRYDPPTEKPHNFNFKNNQYINIYLNGYLTKFTCDSIFSPLYYDINHNRITNYDIKNITKIVIINSSKIDMNFSNMLLNIHIPYLLSNDQITNSTCKNYAKSTDKYKLHNINDLTCYPPYTQLIWIGNPDSLIVDYSKPYIIYKLYDINNNEVVNNPSNYSKVTQIAFFMNNTPGPYPPPNYILIFVLIFIFIVIIGIVYYLFFYNSNDILIYPKNRDLIKIGE